MNYSSLEDVPIPNELYPSHFIYLNLEKINQENYEFIYNEIINFSNLSNNHKINVLSSAITYLSTIRPFQTLIFTLFCELFLKNENFPKEFQSVLIQKLLKSNPKLLYNLIIKDIIKFDLIKDFLRRSLNIVNIFYFNSFLPNFEKEIEFFIKNSNDEIIVQKYLSILKNNPIEFQELIDFGWEKKSLGYILKYDIIEELLILTENSNFNFNQMITWSPFEIYPAPNSKKMITICAYFGSINCFKFLFLNGHNDFYDVIKYAVSGGNLEIIRLLYDVDQQVQTCLFQCARFHHYDVFNWFIDKDEITEDVFADLLKYNNINSFIFAYLSGFTMNSPTEDIYYLFFK